MKKKLALVITTSILFSACASKNCDPRAGGVLNGLQCKEEYKNRVYSLTQELDQEENEKLQLLIEYNELISELTGKKENVEVLKNNLRTMENEINSMETLLNKIDTSAYTDNDINNIDQKLDQLLLALTEIDTRAQAYQPQLQASKKRLLKLSKINYLSNNQYKTKPLLLAKFKYLEQKKYDNLIVNMSNKIKRMKKKIVLTKKYLHSHKNEDRTKVRNTLVDLKRFISVLNKKGSV